MNRVRRISSLAAVCALVTTALFGTTGCGEADTSRPPSLTSPNSIEVATRAECGSQNSSLANFNESGGCNIGLITNGDTNRLAFADLGRRRPFLADLDRGTPGVNHLRVGERPVAVASDLAGTTAFTLNQTGSSITVVDLWRLTGVETMSVPEGPQTLATVAGDGTNGVPWLVVGTRHPNQVTFRPGARCFRDAEQVPDDAPELSSLCVGRDVETDELPLPGRPSTSDAGAAGDFVYVGYKDRPFISVVVPPERDDVLGRQGISCRGSRSAAPCEVDRIGVTYGCSDGIDGDDDGAADQQDLQCYGPKGAESPDGIGRSVSGECSNGMDDDGDGDVDRADEDCFRPGGDEDSRPDGIQADQTVCSNGRDDDGDGDADGADPDCYGEVGQRESAVEVSGVNDLEVGPNGQFAYAVDRANDQILTIDVRRHRLVDAAAAVSPSRTAFTDALGIQVGGSPLAVAPYVTRSVQWRDPQNDGHGIVSHSFGAYATADNGSVFFLEAVRTSCEVNEPSGELLTRREFRTRGEAFANSAEKDCLSLPELPLERDEASDACQRARDCRSCRGGAAPSSAMCDAACETFVEDRQACRASGRISEPGSNVTLATNPRFQRRDTQGRQGRLVGAGQCLEPDSYLAALRTYRQDNPEGSQSLGCFSALRPQPLTIRDNLAEERANFEELPRMDLLARAETNFQPPESNDSGGDVEATVSSVPYDVRLRNETLRVIWEGLLPNSRRDDGLISSDDESVVEVGGMNACDVGVQAGDRFQIRTSPRTGSDAPSSCGSLNAGDNAGTAVRSWRVESVRPGELTIAPISGDDVAAGQLPARGCYPNGFQFQVRTEDEFLVVGGSTGNFSTQRELHGTCVERPEAQDRRYGSRVEPGEWMTGPYYDFQLYDGPVAAERQSGEEFLFDIPVQRNFQSWTYDGALLLGTDVLFAHGVSGGVKMLATDVDRNRIFLRNFGAAGDSNNAEQFLR